MAIKNKKQKKQSEHLPEKLNLLVEEILKEKPNQHLIEELMNTFGLNYSSDPIMQMSTLLNSMTKIKFAKKTTPEVLS